MGRVGFVRVGQAGLAAQRPGRGLLLPALALATAALVALVATMGVQVVSADRIMSGVRVLGVDLGGQTLVAAHGLLLTASQRLAEEPVTLSVRGREWAFRAGELGMQLDTESTLQQAYQVGRIGNPLQRGLAQWGAFLFGVPGPSPLFRFDQRPLESVLAGLAAEVNRPAIDARIETRVARGTVSFAILPEVPGVRLQVPESGQRVREVLSGSLPGVMHPSVADPQRAGGRLGINLVEAVEQPAVTGADLEPARARAERMVEGPVALTFEGKRWSIAAQDLAAALAFEPVVGLGVQVRVDPGALDRALGPVRRDLGQAPVNARFQWDGRAVRLIRESREGLMVDGVALAQRLQERLVTGERTVPVTLTVARPAVASQDGPKLGIKELIKEGRTAFPGSVAEKQHNIRLAASRLHGTVVPPGELFSFNREVGPTTIDAGYKTGWGITLSNEGARTIPSVAGGICQVATTLFHPVFHAGYAIEQRNPHLYWIQSYGQRPLGMRGLDATVDEQSGIDFQFINTTSDNLLIQARVEGTTLIFGLYGVKPAWDVKIEGPHITNVVPTDRTPVQQVEPTMPSGRTLQVEAAQDGFDVIVTRTVTASSEVRGLPLRSRYLPSRNVVLHGPVPEAPGAEGSGVEAPPPNAPQREAPPQETVLPGPSP